jgi:hypothetical protein
MQATEPPQCASVPARARTRAASLASACRSGHGRPVAANPNSNCAVTLESSPRVISHRDALYRQTIVLELAGVEAIDAAGLSLLVFLPHLRSRIGSIAEVRCAISSG